ncbi:MAG: class I SAM-dependent methyltransferase [Candidatus Saganbacteria bacterium]|nr:class I SAM-dependent methyltransferase [Candidatus Saganbacteria bacterium]
MTSLSAARQKIYSGLSQNHKLNLDLCKPYLESHYFDFHISLERNNRPGYGKPSVHPPEHVKPVILRIPDLVSPTNKLRALDVGPGGYAEPCGIAEQLSKLSPEFTLDVLEITDRFIDFINEHPHQLSDRINPILGDALDPITYLNLGEYSLIVSLSIFHLFGTKELAAASFLMLLSTLKPDGLFILDSPQMANFAKQIGLPEKNIHLAESRTIF